MEKEKSKKMFNNYGSQGSQLYDRMTSNHPTHKWLMQYSIMHALNEVKDKTLLDIACGDGDYLLMALEQGAKQVTGIDMSAEILALSKKKLSDHGFQHHVDLKECDGSVVTHYKNGPFDCILCNFVICYASNSDTLNGFCRNIAENLNPDGCCVLTNSRGTLESERRKLMLDRFGVEYAEMVAGVAPQMFSPVYCKFPNGWATEFCYIDNDTVEQALIKAGLSFERAEITPNPEVQQSDRWTLDDITLLADLVPFQQWTITRKQ